MGVDRLLIITSVICLVALARSAPSRVKYDQRQEGDLNVRADLENFVILVIPTSAGATPSTLGLLELLSKAIPTRGHNKRQKNGRKPIHPAPSLLEDVGISEDDTQTFIESKTAPYHVDISKSRKNLAKLHPNLDAKPNGQEELLVSPNLSLIKSAEEDDEDHEDKEGHGRQSRMFRLSKGFVLSMPLEVEEGLVHIDNNKRIEKSKETKENKEAKDTRKKADFIKNKDKINEPKLKLLLLGAEHDEECGPGYQRDQNGVCQFLAHV